MEIAGINCDIQPRKMSGPLKNLKSEPFAIEDYYSFQQKKIGLIGETYAGKSQSIKELVFSLGGVYQEKMYNDTNRTGTDDSFIFAESYENSLRKTTLVRLRSHAGHMMGEQGYPLPEAEDKILVVKNLSSRSISGQFSSIFHALRFNKEKYPLLITRLNDLSELSTRRRNQLNKEDFKKIYLVDNQKKKEYPLRTFNKPNVDYVLDFLRKDNQTFKLIYFGDENIPESLEGLVTKFDNHFVLTEPIPVEKEEEMSAEEKLIKAIFREKESFI